MIAARSSVSIAAATCVLTAGEAVDLTGQVGLVGARAVVVGAARVDGEAEGHRVQGARLVAGHLQTLDVRREVGGAAADLFGRPPRALGEQRTQVGAVRRSRRGRAAPRRPSPNRSQGASMRPRSAHSMAQAIVPPAEMVSRPSSSHRALASSTSSASATPHIDPTAKTF